MNAIFQTKKFSKAKITVMQISVEDFIWLENQFKAVTSAKETSEQCHNELITRNKTGQDSHGALFFCGQGSLHTSVLWESFTGFPRRMT